MDIVKFWDQEKTGGSTFFGKRIDELSREELLGVIGYFVKSREDTEKNHARDVAILTLSGYRRFR